MKRDGINCSLCPTETLRKGNIFATVAVTTCNAETALLILDRIKMNWRSSCGRDWLTGLAQIEIEDFQIELKFED